MIPGPGTTVSSPTTPGVRFTEETMATHAAQTKTQHQTQHKGSN